jgi:hypothetical protein
MEAGLCERLHCRPSELDQEDVGRIMRGFSLLDLYRDMMAMARGEDISDDASIRIGKALEMYARERA